MESAGRGIPFRFVLLAMTLGILSFAPARIAQAQNDPHAALAELKGKFSKRVNEDTAEIASNQALLSRTQAAHQEALSDNDSDGISVTNEAISNAQEALTRARQNLADDQFRISLIDQLLARPELQSDAGNPTQLNTQAESRKKADMDLLVDTILGHDGGSAWPGPPDPNQPLVNPLTAPHEAMLDANARLLLVSAGAGFAGPDTAELREATLREMSGALGERYAADLGFRKQIDDELDAAIRAVAEKRELEVAAAEDRRFARLRGAVDELERHGLVQKGSPLEDQEKSDPALHGALEDARTKTRGDEEEELMAIADGTAADLKMRIQKLAADNRLGAEVWEKQAKSQ